METDTVLITGCSSGIGDATARRFQADGWHVYATARDPDDLTALADLGCETARLDVTDADRIRTVVDRIIDDTGRIDCLVNNAGYGQFGPVEDVPVDAVHDQFDVNVYGPHRLNRAVLSHMRERESGTIVNLSSTAGRVSFPASGVYSGSKFALEAMSDALRGEVAPLGIDVVLVEPGPVTTAFGERAETELSGLDRSDAYASIYRLLEDTHVIGESGIGASSPEDVAAVILNAATVTDPAPRYPVGVVAEATMLLRFLPDTWRDAAYRLVSRFVR